MESFFNSHSKPCAYWLNNKKPQKIDWPVSQGRTLQISPIQMIIKAEILTGWVTVPYIAFEKFLKRLQQVQIYNGTEN